MESLSSENADRNAVAAWAYGICSKDEVDIEDETVDEVLESLHMADLPAHDRGYLYTEVDFLE